MNRFMGFARQIFFIHRSGSRRETHFEEGIITSFIYIDCQSIFEFSHASTCQHEQNNHNIRYLAILLIL